MLITLYLIQTALASIVVSSSVTGRARIASSETSVAKLPGHLFVNQEYLQKGGSGNVYRVTNAETHDTVAVKVIDKRGGNFLNEFGPKSIIREISVHELLDHEHVVKFLNVLESERYVYFFTELCEGGDLLTALDSLENGKGGFTEDQARIYFTEILNGVQYLHNNNIIHRDIKLENILLNAGGKIKIADMGCAITAGITVTERCGTREYIAFEAWSGGALSFKVDVFSLGVLLFALLSGCMPFGQGFDIRDTTTDSIVYFDSMSPSVIELLKGMLQKLPNDRMDMAMVWDHPWMRSEETKDSTDESFNSFDQTLDGHADKPAMTEKTVVENAQSEIRGSLSRSTDVEFLNALFEGNEWWWTVVEMFIQVARR